MEWNLIGRLLIKRRCTRIGWPEIKWTQNSLIEEAFPRWEINNHLIINTPNLYAIFPSHADKNPSPCCMYENRPKSLTIQQETCQRHANSVTDVEIDVCDIIGVDKEEQLFLFNVTRNERNEYEILDGSCQSIINLPTISFDKTEAWDCLIKILEHLTTFKYFERIENRNPNAFFENSFAYHFSDAVENEMKMTEFLNVRHEFELSLTFQNLSDRTLYLAIFELNLSWQIESFIRNSDESEFKIMPPKNDSENNDKTEIKWNMNVSESFKNMKRCENTLKIFVISERNSFAIAMLFKISRSVNVSDKFIRSENHDQLWRFFFSKLKTNSLRNAKDDSLNEKWIFRNFPIRTTISVMLST